MAWVTKSNKVSRSKLKQHGFAVPHRVSDLERLDGTLAGENIEIESDLSNLPKTSSQTLKESIYIINLR